MSGGGSVHACEEETCRHASGSARCWWSVSRGALALLVAAALLAHVVGCGGRDSAAVPAPARVAEVSGKACSLRVSVDRERITTAQRVRVDIEASADVGWSISLPLKDSAFVGWTIVERSDAAPSVSGMQRESRRTTMLLEPFLEGDYAVPRIELSVRQRGASGTTVASEAISSDPIPVRVDPVLAAGDETADVPAPADYTPAPQGRSWLGPGAAVVGLVSVFGLAWWLRQRRAQAVLTVDTRDVDILRLRRAVERGAAAEISADLIASVLAATGSRASNPDGAGERQDLTARLDGWRFGGVRAEGSAPLEAAQSALRLIAARRADRETEDVA